MIDPLVIEYRKPHQHFATQKVFFKNCVFRQFQKRKKDFQFFFWKNLKVEKLIIFVIILNLHVAHFL